MDTAFTKMKYMTLFIILFLSLLTYGQTITKISIKNSSTYPGYGETASALINALNDNHFTGKEAKLGGINLSAQGMVKIKTLLKNNKIYCSATSLELNVVKLPLGASEIRGIPLNVISNDGISSSEEGVIVFSQTGQIHDLFFGLENQRYSALLENSVDVTDLRRRQMILSFIEDYRTAYNRKDINYIESVFSDNALIILGVVVQNSPTSQTFAEKNLGKQTVELIKLNKTEYIDRLRKGFEYNKKIYCEFEKIELSRHRKIEYLYGVTLKQKWFQDNYSDTGYLFLMIDFRDELKPQIHVRAWQPDEFTTESEVLNLSSFQVVGE